MNIVLTQRQQQILKDLMSAGDLLLIELGNKAIDGTLTSSEIGELCGFISNAFMMNGIDEDSEPNEYGLELEGLLDAVNRSRLL